MIQRNPVYLIPWQYKGTIIANFHFRWTRPPFRMSQAYPTKQADILLNFPKRIPHSYPFGVYQWANAISDRTHSILRDGVCEERQAVYCFPLLKPVKESLIHRTKEKICKQLLLSSNWILKPLWHLPFVISVEDRWRDSRASKWPAPSGRWLRFWFLGSQGLKAARQTTSHVSFPRNGTERWY